MEQGSNPNKTADLSGVSYEWPHTLSEIIMALRKVGLVIDLFNEFPFSPYNCFPSLEEKIPGEFTIEGQSKGIPLTFSIKATYIPGLAQKG